MHQGIPICTVLWLVVLFSSGCSLLGEISPETNKKGQIDPNVSNRGNAVRRPPNNLSDKDIKDLILASCRINRLVPLTDSRRRARFELRLWINIGMPYDERLLIIRGTEDSSQAAFYHLQAQFDGGGKFRKQVLGDPRAGWGTVRAEISDRLAAPQHLVPDPQFGFSNHEGLIYLEVVENGEYRIVYYGQHSKFDDAVRLKDLCRYLSTEFGLDIDCWGERTWLGPIQ